MSIVHLILRIESFFSKSMFVVKTQKVSFKSFKEPFSPILDLGGGGEGVVGQLYQNKVTAIDLRQSELDEVPNGPLKVCADARNLPFANNSFKSVTAFYFFMYVNPQDYLQVIRETYRVLEANGTFFIWDTMIPKREKLQKTLFVVPLLAILPHKTIATAYGVKWENHFLNDALLINMLKEVGFKITSHKASQSAFYIECSK